MNNEQEFLRIQNELREKISLSDSVDPAGIKTVAGVDLAYWQKDGEEYAVCCIVVIDRSTHEIVEKQHFSGKIEVPYMPGFLAFRELPLVLKTAQLLKTQPDLYIFDGNGYLHPRHMGIATHASFYLNRPTIGIAKTYFRVDKKTDYTEPDSAPGSYTDIVIEGEVYGRVLRTHRDVNPVFVSVGSGISLATACALAMELTGTESRVPIPTRLADLETHIERERLTSTDTPDSPADRYGDIKAALCKKAQEDGSIRAVIAIGSSTRQDTPADEFSDLDLIIVTDDPERWFSGEYPAILGEISISFIEPTLGGGKERRSIYSGGRDADMIILTPEQFTKALEDGTAGWVMNRGYSFLCDKEGYSAAAERYVSREVSRMPMPEDEFQNTVNDFFFHCIWACKKLMRGELWSAKMCIDAYLKQRLLKIAEEYHLALDGRDVWHDGRFIDSWAEPDVKDELRSCFARYDADECKKSLDATFRLFVRLASAAAEKRGYHYPEKAEKCAEDFLSSNMR